MSVLVGRVGLVIKGAWDSSVAYAAMDVVTYTNSTYIAKQAVPAGTLPTNTAYWELSLDASLLQTKTMSSPVTIGGESKTTVEAAVGALEDVKADKTAISSVEPSATAVSAHAVGSYFINASGQFVKATSAIAVGDTIIVKPAVGYNCEGTTVGDVLEAANAVDSVADGNLHPVTSNAVFDHFSNYIKIKENLRGDTDAGGKMNIPTSDLPLTSYPLLGYNTDGWCAIFYKYSNQWRARLFSVGANGVEILANKTNVRLDIVYVNL